MSFRKFTLVASLLLAGSLLSSRAGDSPWKQDRLLVTFWCPPPANDTHLAAVAADGYNVTGTPEAGLDVARRHGLAAMLQDELLNPEVLDDPARRARLDALIDRVKGHPALLAYYLTDEPGAGAFAGWGRLVEYLRRRDPAHFAYINLFPTYANNAQLGTAGDTETAYREHLRRFVATVKPELISYDHYHFFQGRDGDQYFLNLAMIREAARDAGVPFLNIIQACTIEKVWRLVNPDELRFLVYTTLAYGGRGISYFLHWGPVSYGGLYQDGVRMPLADAVAGLNREINALSPPLMKLRSLGVYHSAPCRAAPNPFPIPAPSAPAPTPRVFSDCSGPAPGRPPSCSPTAGTTAKRWSRSVSPTKSGDWRNSIGGRDAGGASTAGAANSPGTPGFVPATGACSGGRGGRDPWRGEGRRGSGAIGDLS